MKDNFDKIVQDKLRGMRIDPPTEVWESIERDLAKASPLTPRKKTLWPSVARYGAAACLAGALIVTATLLLNREAAVEQFAAIIPTDTTACAQDTPYQTEATVAAIATVTPSATVQALSLFGQKTAAPGTSAPSVSSPTPTDATPKQAPENTGSKAAPADIPTRNENAAVHENHPSQAQQAGQSNRPILRDYYNPVRQSRYGSPGRNKISGGLYAANFGGGRSSAGGDMASNGKYMLRETVSRGDEAFNGAAPASYMLTPEITSTDHRIPLSAGAEVSFDLSERISLETGLTYTYLRSDFTAKGTVSDYEIKQELHYVGIPVAITYNFVQMRTMDFYVRGGGMLEKGVSGTRKTTIPDSQATEKSTLKMEGIQASLQAAAGVEVKLSRALGFYFEPGVGYYPSQDNQPESYRTENPVTFNLKAGLRVKLRGN